ncbi:phage tail assembly protein T [Pelistega ratti]|uniref:phage tail assembly protein T n=1 Tax=Pelistega ratti TaxID=2652177 RepID=UPI00135CF349
MIREDFRAGTIAATIANTVVKKPMQAFDFMPFYTNSVQEDNSLLDGVEIL